MPSSNIAYLIHIADVIACQEQLRFYLSAQNDVVNPALLEMLGLTDQQVAEVRETLPRQLAEAESTLTAA